MPNLNRVAERLPKSTFRDVDLSESEFADVSLKGSRFENVAFTGATLRNTELLRAYRERVSG